jgi:hypothetical protein
LQAAPISAPSSKSNLAVDRSVGISLVDMF